jgi:hypothetical protein
VVDSGLAVPPAEKWYSTKDIYEQILAHARENVESFTAINAHLLTMQGEMVKQGHALEMLGLRLEPLAELKRQLVVVEGKADAAHQRLDTICAQGDGRQGVSKAVLWVLTAVSLTFAIWERLR